MQTNLRKSFNRRKYCSKCRSFGNHSEALCNERIQAICPLCASKYHSSTHRCPLQTCTICNGKHSDRMCRQIPIQQRCSICNMNGHADSVCTNNWRLFHSVTSVKDLDKISVPVYRTKGITCTLCGSKHHHSFTCSNLKNTPFCFNMTPKQEAVDRIKSKAAIRHGCANPEKSNDEQLQEPTEETTEELIVEQAEQQNGEQNEEQNGGQTEEQDDNSFFVIDRAGNDGLVQQTDNYYTVDQDMRDERPTQFKKTNSDKRTKLKTAVSLLKNKYEHMQRGKLIDKNIRSVATRFNAINARNVANFQPPSSDDETGEFGRSRKKRKRSKPAAKPKKEPKRKFKIHRQLGQSNGIAFKQF